MHLRDGIQTHPTVAQRYEHLVETGEISDDPAQRPVVAALDRLNDEIRAKRLARKSSALGWLFAKNRQSLEPVKGLYIHGGVGRGKTMLMDMFFDTVPVRRKRRVHFNAFMADVHDRIQKHRLARKNGDGQGGRPDPAGRQGACRRGLGAVLRRILGDRHRRRDDPVAAVFGAVRQRRGAGGDVQRRARRSLPRWAEPASCSCLSSAS